MTKTTFINRLAQQSGLTNEQSTTVINLIENHNILSNSEKEASIAHIASELDLDSTKAKSVYSSIKQIIYSEIKSQTVKWIAGTAVIIIAGIIVFRLRKK